MRNVQYVKSECPWRDIAVIGFSFRETSPNTVFVGITHLHCNITVCMWRSQVSSLFSKFMIIGHIAIGRFLLEEKDLS